MPNSALALCSGCKVTQSTSRTTQFDSQLAESIEKDAGQKEVLPNVLDVFYDLERECVSRGPDRTFFQHSRGLEAVKWNRAL